MTLDWLGSSRYPMALSNGLRTLYAPDDARRIIELRPLMGYRPLPAARRFHESKAVYRYALGGNRSSKSEALAVEVAWWLTGLHPWLPIAPAPIIWYATDTFELTGTIIWPKLKRLLTGFDYEVTWISRGEEIPRLIRVNRDGGTALCQFKAYEQGRETFQGGELDLAAFDEQFPRDVYIETITRLGAERPFRFAAALTPIDPQPWLEEKLRAPSSDTEVFSFPLDDNRISRGGFLDDAKIDAAIAEWPAEVVETRRNGKWGSYLGSVFQTFQRAVHVVEPADEHKFLLAGDETQRWLRPESHATGAIDWGGANPFCFLWAVRLPHLDNAWYVFDEYYWETRKDGVRLLWEHGREITNRTKRWRTTLRQTWADHDPTDARELEAAKTPEGVSVGVPSSPARKDKLAGIEAVQTLLKVRPDTQRPRLYIASRCVNLIRQMSTYRWEEGTDRKDARNEPVKVDDHAVDSLRYLIYSERELEAPPLTMAGTMPAYDSAANQLTPIG